MPIQPSPIPSSALAIAINEPPPELPSSTTTSAPRRIISSWAVWTSVMHASWRQSVSLFVYRVPKPSTA